MISTTSSCWRRPAGMLSELSIRARALAVSAAAARSSSSRLVWASGPVPGSARRAASWVSARSGSPPTSQRPSLPMPMGTTSKRERSIAAMTEAAPAKDTSCSPDRPPNTMPTRSFLAPLSMDSVVSNSLGASGKFSEAHRDRTGKDDHAKQPEGPDPARVGRGAHARRPVEGDAEGGGPERAHGEAHGGLQRHRAPEIRRLRGVRDPGGDDGRLGRHEHTVEQAQRDEPGKGPMQRPADAQRAGRREQHEGADRPRAAEPVREQPGKWMRERADGEHARGGVARALRGFAERGAGVDQAGGEERNDP